jgi:hypothetical protein
LRNEARLEKIEDANSILVRRCGGSVCLGTPRHTLVDIKMDLKEIGREVVE